MPTRDWFAAFAVQVDPESRATRATCATDAPKPRKSAIPEDAAAVAQAGSTRATGATPAGDAGRVAHVAQASDAWATDRVTPDFEENCCFPAAVARVAHVAHEREHDPHGAADATDWRELYQERAAMRQYSGGYGRDVAERLAYGECIEHWCELHPEPLKPELCAGCRAPLVADVLDLPDGARVHWEREREFWCLVAYGFRRKRRAVAALAALGVQPPTDWGA